jgi:hypothetical protein
MISVLFLPIILLCSSVVLYGAHAVSEQELKKQGHEGGLEGIALLVELDFGSPKGLSQRDVKELKKKFAQQIGQQYPQSPKDGLAIDKYGK